MTPTPDTKKIAAEMREEADWCENAQQPGLADLARKLRSLADALDPQPMGIEEAIEVIGRDRFSDPELRRAAAVIVAHYEATKAEPRKTGELVTEVSPETYEAIRVAALNLDPHDFNVTIPRLKAFLSRCVVRP